MSDKSRGDWWADKAAELEGERNEWMDYAKALKAENESLHKDAERYRWLKEHGVSRQIVGSGSQSVGFGPCIIMTLPSCGAPSSIALTFESADYAIDAAISSTEKP